MTSGAFRQDPPLRTDPTVAEGGTIVVSVGADTHFVYFKPPGQTPTRVRVVNGRAEYRVPPSVRGGSVIYISDMTFPNPTSTEVLVVGGQGS